MIPRTKMSRENREGNLGGLASATLKKEGQILVLLESLEKYVDSHQARLNRLYSRLIPVMDSSSPEDESEISKGEGSSPKLISVRLQVLVSKMEGASELVDEITDRIQL